MFLTLVTGRKLNRTGRRVSPNDNNGSIFNQNHQVLLYTTTCYYELYFTLNEGGQERGGNTFQCTLYYQATAFTIPLNVARLQGVINKYGFDFYRRRKKWF